MNLTPLEINPGKSFMAEDVKQKKLARLEALEAKARLQQGLPHLYGFKFYPWARKFFDSRNQFNFLVGPNQCSKSSTMIRKCIHWATADELWSSLWRNRPNIFWYLYPSMDVADIEVQKKWVPEFLPRNEFRDHPKFGWKIRTERGKVVAIDFNSGVTVLFKAYTQNVQHLQTGTVFAMFVDEELPIELYPELKFRLEAVDGYYHTAFTATLGQDFWREVIEGKGPETPFPDALKLQIGLYDCQVYEDGSPSFWTKEKIQRAIATCPNEREVQRRAFGKFVRAEGLRVPSFDRLKNVKKPNGPPPKDWLVYAGVDIGSGGADGHPAAITFLAVNPNFREARVFKHWNGKGIPTTSGDILLIFQQLRGEMRCAGQVYDFSSKDFYTLATRAGEAFMPADKTIAAGDDTVNSLFKHGIVTIDDIPENFKLISEMENLGVNQRKSKAVDDSFDSFRYVSMAVPWDWTVILTETPTPTERPKSEVEIRREAFFPDAESGMNLLFEEEIAEWNDYYEV